MAKKNGYCREHYLRYELAWHSIVMFAATIVGGCFNCLYHVYTERFLETEEHGAISRSVSKSQHTNFSLAGSLKLMSSLDLVANLSLLPVSLLYIHGGKKNDIHHSADI